MKRKYKKTVLVNQSTGFLMIDVANVYVEQYDEVILLTGNIEQFERKLSTKVKVKKILKYNKKSNISRLFTWSLGSFQIFFKLLLFYFNYEVIYFTNPPMAYLFSVLLKNRFSIVIYDIYPDALKNIGIKENNIFYKYWVKKNKVIFNKAEKIITLGEGMANQIAQYIDKEKIRIIPNWAGSDNLGAIDKKDNPFIKSNNLENKFIVLYSGNIGFTHNVETIIEVAKKLKKNNIIHFLIIGEGKKKAYLIEEANKNNLGNCTFLTWQPNEILPFSLASADLGVVTLNNDSSALSLPSKTYNLLAVGVPLLCIAPESSDISRMIRKYNNGKYFSIQEIDKICDFILSLLSDKNLHSLLSNNSIKAAKDFSYHNAEKYI